MSGTIDFDLNNIRILEETNPSPRFCIGFDKVTDEPYVAKDCEYNSEYTSCTCQTTGKYAVGFYSAAIDAASPNGGTPTKTTAGMQLIMIVIFP